MLGSRGLEWYSQRGSSLVMLLMVWGILIGFLGVAFDLAMAYVYRQQVRTAMEAAVTAGARQGEYEMTVELHRKLYEWVCEPISNPDGTKGPDCRRVLRVTGTDVVHVTGREKDVWAPYRYRRVPLYQVHPGLCRPRMESGAYEYCERAEVIKNSCRVVEKHPGDAVEAARVAFDQNKQRWAGKLQNISGGVPTLVAQGQQFEVKMSVQAEMPTMFLRMIGIPTIPIRVLGAELGDHAAKIVRLGDDPCRS